MILKKACFASIFLVPLHCQKRNGVLLMEKRHVTTRETACCSETDRVKHEKIEGRRKFAFALSLYHYLTIIFRPFTMFRPFRG